MLNTNFAKNIFSTVKSSKKIHRLFFFATIIFGQISVPLYCPTVYMQQDDLGPVEPFRDDVPCTDFYIGHTAKELSLSKDEISLRGIPLNFVLLLNGEGQHFIAIPNTAEPDKLIIDQNWVCSKVYANDNNIIVFTDNGTAPLMLIHNTKTGKRFPIMSWTWMMPNAKALIPDVQRNFAKYNELPHLAYHCFIKAAKHIYGLDAERIVLDFFLPEQYHSSYDTDGNVYVTKKTLPTMSEESHEQKFIQNLLKLEMRIKLLQRVWQGVLKSQNNASLTFELYKEYMLTEKLFSQLTVEWHSFMTNHEQHERLHQAIVAALRHSKAH